MRAELREARVDYPVLARLTAHDEALRALAEITRLRKEIERLEIKNEFLTKENLNLVFRMQLLSNRDKYREIHEKYDNLNESQR